MSDIHDQPPPRQNDSRPIWEIVREELFTVAPKPGHEHIFAAMDQDMAERDKVGRERYGVPLQAFNGRDCLVDMYQELLDAIVYIRQHLEEIGLDAPNQPIDIYEDVLALAVEVRGMIIQRKKEQN